MAQSGASTPHSKAELSSSAAHNLAVGTLLLIPSAVYSDEFVSSLVVLNMDTEPNNVLIFATGSGESIGSLTITLGVGQRFRSTNICSARCTARFVWCHSSPLHEQSVAFSRV